jgi:hypothetical protein
MNFINKIKQRFYRRRNNPICSQCGVELFNEKHAKVDPMNFSMAETIKLCNACAMKLVHVSREWRMDKK